MKSLLISVLCLAAMAVQADDRASVRVLHSPSGSPVDTLYIGLPYEFEMYQDWHKNRTSIRPGITGLWQVAGRSEVAFEDMILLDLYYLYNRSFIMDMNILFETFFALVERRGAY